MVIQHLPEISQCLMERHLGHDEGLLVAVTLEGKSVNDKCALIWT